MAMEKPELPAHREERSGGGGGGGGVESSGGGGGGGGGEDQVMDIMYSKRGCCFWIPCFGSDHLPSSQSATQSGGSVWWERIRTAEKEDRWWTKGWKVLKKVREWSEIVAGPKWKTFIRRFRKNHRGGGGGFGIRGRKYNYDPLSYSLNFEEADAHLEEDFDQYPDFSSRYASIPISAKSSMDLGKDGPNFI